jgi:gamma-glutamylcyclotransferase (GGCT)/AIG2-like uncharacterized protein YtfP
MLTGRASFLGMGSFRGKLYHLGRYPGAVVSGGRTDRVYGEIYRLRRAAALFQSLDRYEGKLFTRRRIAVHSGNGKKMISWVYLYRGRVGEAWRIHGGDYLEFRAGR